TQAPAVTPPQDTPAATEPAEPAAVVDPPQQEEPPADPGEEPPFVDGEEPPQETPPEEESAGETVGETEAESTQPTQAQETDADDVPPTERETPPPLPQDDGHGGQPRMDKWNLTITIDHFALLSDEDGNFLALRNTEDYTEEEAEEIMNGILALGRKQGMYGWLQYYTTEKDYGTLIVVTDKTSDQGLLNKLFTSTVVIGILTLLVLLGFLIFFSRWITKPVQTAFDRQKQFVSDAGHELKTPLAVLTANADILQDEIGENKWLGYMQEQTGRMSQLVGDLLRLARMDNPAQEYVFQEFNLSTAVAATALPFESAAFERHRNLEIDIQPDVRYRGSEQHIRQLCAIFIDNALKYSDENGIIKVTLLKRGDNCIMEFYNTGCEISPEETEKIFERFYRGDKARNNKGKNGYGLGLAIAKSIMEVHKIKIRVTCEQGRWIRFLLTM
ncbi:MAG: hypothetical protein IJ055_01990, partial [Oscillospiraceae bacterium]|nr:hypothetical protein [Oscillospiraceae bacterium]